eukprot:833723-Prymnesium_polylepis.1
MELAHSGGDNPLHCRRKPFSAPLLHQPAIDNSADVLHLIFINMFAFFMEMTLSDHDPRIAVQHLEPTV